MVFIKEALINISSMVSFLVPIALIFYLQEWKTILGTWAGVFLLTLIFPPVGWMRPHRHSDIPSNRRN